MKILAKIVHGSHLYETNIPNLSDLDYKIIYLPEIKDCLLLKVRSAWEEDKTLEQDTSYFSLQHFLDMARQGQSIAIELLSAPKEKWLSFSPIWEYLHKNRKLFYTKNMHSFLGYAKTMAHKYSSRIDRLQETENILKVLDQTDQFSTTHNWGKLYEIWDQLPESLNAKKTINERNNNKDKRVYQVCGRELQCTVSIYYAYEIVKSIYDSYGERVKKAKEGKIEWKSLAHAFRAAYQVKEIVETNDLTFPLKNADWLKKLRLGQFDYIKDGLDDKLNNLIAETQILINKSNLPEKVDNKFIENIILEAYDYYNLVNYNQYFQIP